MAARTRLVHVTTADISLELLLGPQLRAFRDAGYDVITASAPGPFVDRLEADGITHVPLRHATRASAPHRDVAALAELYRLFRSLRPDIVHTHNPKPGVYGRVAARAAGVPAIVNTQHGLYATPGDPWSRRAWVYSLERAAAACSHAELVQNPEDVDTLVRFGVPRRKLHLLGNGIDLARFDPAAVPPEEVRRVRQSLGAGPDTVLVGAVGRLVAEKGYRELFAAAERLRETAPRVQVVVAGPHDPERPDALSERELDRARASGVQVLGMVDDVEALYAALDVYVLASHREGFPRSAMEAAAMSLPVVATDIRGCREVVEPGVTGLLLPPQDPGALASALAELAADGGLRREMGDRGHAKAHKQFDQERVIERTVDVYERLGGKRRRTRSPHRRIRVLWLIKGLGPGGAEQLLVHHAALADHDRFSYEVTFLLPHKNHLVPELRKRGVAVSCLEARGGDPRWALRLRRRLRKRPVDILHTHSPAVAAVARSVTQTLPRRLRPALMYTEHNRWGQYGGPTRLLNRLTYPLDRTQVAVSDGVRESIPAPFRDPVEVVVHGIDLERARREAARAVVRAELHVSDDEILIGTVANLRPTKRYDILFDAARIVADRVPRARFVAVGQGPLEAQVEAWRHEAGLDDRFQLLGYRRDALRIMSAFDVFVLASDHEGLPVAVMEALALGLPVVATSVGGLPEAIQDGVEGRLVPRRRPDLLAGALVELAEDPSLRAGMASAAIERASVFDVGQAVERVEALYRRLTTCAA